MKNVSLRRLRTLWFAVLIGVITLVGSLYLNTKSVLADEAETQGTDEEIQTVLKFRDGEVPAELSVTTFMRDSMRFHKELALLAMGLAGVAYDDGRPTLGSGEYLIPAYHSLGFTDDNIWLFSYPKNELNRTEEEIFTDNSLAFSIACRDLGDQLLMILNFRGSSADEDWEYNFLGLSETQGRSFYGENNAWPGFIEFVDGLKKGLNLYIEAHPFVKQADATGKLVAFVVGHSLGGAAANLTGKLLNEGDAGLENLDPSRIFVYTFAAPLVSLDVTQDANIHNVVNDNDIVPHLPIGRKHYGVDYHFSTGSSLYECHTMMTYARAVMEERIDPIAPAMSMLQGVFKSGADDPKPEATTEVAPVDMQTEADVTEANATEENVTDAIATTAVAIGKADATQPASAEVTQPSSEAAGDSGKIGSPNSEPMPDDYHNVIPYILVIGGGLIVLLILGIVIHAVKKGRKRKH
ncbi:MAG: lipase family protein [Lachnospiraceae bacterium]|nr:lipase family protein [Lachnospiraceae bacterium]